MIDENKVKRLLYKSAVTKYIKSGADVSKPMPAAQELSNQRFAWTGRNSSSAWNPAGMGSKKQELRQQPAINFDSPFHWDQFTPFGIKKREQNPSQGVFNATMETLQPSSQLPPLETSPQMQSVMSNPVWNRKQLTNEEIEDRKWADEMRRNSGYGTDGYGGGLESGTPAPGARPIDAGYKADVYASDPQRAQDDAKRQNDFMHRAILPGIRNGMATAYGLFGPPIPPGYAEGLTDERQYAHDLANFAAGAGAYFASPFLWPGSRIPGSSGGTLGQSTSKIRTNAFPSPYYREIANGRVFRPSGALGGRQLRTNRFRTYPGENVWQRVWNDETGTLSLDKSNTTGPWRLVENDSVPTAQQIDAASQYWKDLGVNPPFQAANTRTHTTLNSWLANHDEAKLMDYVNTNNRYVEYTDYARRSGIGSNQQPTPVTVPPTGVPVPPIPTGVPVPPTGVPVPTRPTPPRTTPRRRPAPPQHPAPPQQPGQPAPLKPIPVSKDTPLTNSNDVWARLIDSGSSPADLAKQKYINPASAGNARQRENILRHNERVAMRQHRPWLIPNFIKPNPSGMAPYFFSGDFWRPVGAAALLGGLGTAGVVGYNRSNKPIEVKENQDTAGSSEPKKIKFR